MLKHRAMKRGRTHLINEVLAMVVAQFLRPDDAMHIGLHQLLNEIYLRELMNGGRSKDVENGDYVLVMKMAK
jgi:hypothetical protein